MFKTISTILLTICWHLVSANGAYTVLLKAGAIDPKPNAQSFINSISDQEKTGYYILQFDENPNQSTHKILKESGINLLEYVHGKAFLSYLEFPIDNTALINANLRAGFDYSPSFKFLSDQLKQYSFLNQERVVVNISNFSNVDQNTLKSEIINNIIGVIFQKEENPSVLTAIVDEDKITQIAQIEGVKWIEGGNAPYIHDDVDARGLHRNNVLDTDYDAGRKYDGTGVVCALADDGLVGPHIDYQGRITQYTSVNNGDHGDMTVGILMGSGNLNPKYRGAAAGTDMHYYSIGGYPHVNNAVNNLNNLGTVITSTSYSQGTGGVYNSSTQFIDQQIFQNSSLIHIFSAGNAGASDHGYGAGPGWGNITGGYKAGKNVIATGNLDSRDGLTPSSSRGPADDGRIKPDICANGTNQISTSVGNNYSPGGGTSAAAPGIAGITSQLYEAYKTLNQGQNPESALIKAALLNSAEDLGNVGPDFIYGWGRVNGFRAVEILENNNYLKDSIVQGQLKSHTIQVPNGVEQLKVMLYWLDAGGSTIAAKSLVNDLDISLTTPNATIVQPWVLDPTPNPSNLNQPATRGRDDLNNMEQVTVDNPNSGNYTVNINGFDVPFGEQKYYVVYEFRYSAPKVTYPIGGESLIPGDQEIIRWDAHGDSAPFTVEYSIDSGINWLMIDPSVAPALRYANWTVPNSIGSNTIIKVSRSGESGSSLTSFNIMPVAQNLRVRWACTDSFQIAWDSVDFATTYEISRLGNKYMDSIDVTSNIYYTFRNLQSTSNYWVAVRAKGNNNLKGQRSVAIEKVAGTFDCPVPNDVSVSKILSPSSDNFPSCQELDSINVKILLENKGTTTEGGFPVQVMINGIKYTSSYSGSLAPYETAEMVFPMNFNFSVQQQYQVSAWSDLVNDAKRTNDTSKAVVNIYPGTPYGLPFNQNFNSFNQCSNATNCEATVCNLFDGWINKASFDDIDWRTFSGSTASAGTGPGSDVGGNGNYLYLEASGNPVCTDKTALLISPCIDLRFAQQPFLDFNYHMWGGDMGELHVDILVEGEWHNDILTPITGDQGNSWQLASINLNNYAGSIVNFRFRGVTGSNFQSDIAIDEISVYDNFQFQIDCSITQIINPSLGDYEDCLLPDSLDVIVVIQNSGLTNIGNFNMGFSINGSSPQIEFYTNILAPGAIDTFQFAQSTHLSGVGTYHLRAWQQYGLDQNPGNDTAHGIINVVSGTTNTIPFQETFDAFNNCVTTTGCGSIQCPLSSGWKNLQNGVDDDIDFRVNNGPTISTNTGPSNDQNSSSGNGKYLYLEVSGGCDQNTAILQSPCIDLNGIFAPELSFWYHMYGTDMGSLHLDVLLGDQWITDFINPIVGDQGNSWNQINVDLSLFAGNIISLRLRGETATGFRGDMALDNISMYETYAQPLASFNISNSPCSGDTVTFQSSSTGPNLNESWNFGPNANPSNATGPGPHQVVFNKYGFENISLTASNPVGIDTKTETILVDTLPTSNFLIQINNQTVEFLNQSSYITSVFWDFGDGQTSTDFLPIHTYANPGLYTASLVGYSSCGTDTATLGIALGVNSVQEFQKSLLSIHPVPSHDYVLINGLENLSNYDIEITNVQGELINSLYNVNIDENHKIDVHQLADGVYFLKVSTPEWNKIFKLIKSGE